MFTQKTTLVVGAGASCELGLPSGAELKNLISARLSPNHQNTFGFANPAMNMAMRATLTNNRMSADQLDPYKYAAEKIRKGLPHALSIDNYLHSHQGNVDIEKVGKLAIALCILEAERNSHLFPKPLPKLAIPSPEVKQTPTLKNSELYKSWYPLFGQLLMSQIQKKDVVDSFSNVSFVIFNYDRCLEQYLWMALQAYFDIDGSTAARALSSVKFIHPYGSLGLLPWQSASADSLALGETDYKDIWKISEGVKTFTESVHSNTSTEVRTAVKECSTLIILGFGYLDQNLQLLRSGQNRSAYRILSTAFKSSGPDQEMIRQEMSKLGNPALANLYIEPGQCSDLFNNHRLLLSLA